ncbi:MAG TPA: hypothetical protein VKG24_19120 [Pseudolabrys sp.]|nr:hypothetical protein [Pseudolabrys sp.]
MPRRAMGRWRAVTAFATAFVAGDAGSERTRSFFKRLFPFRYWQPPPRPLMGTYEILREDT